MSQYGFRIWTVDKDGLLAPMVMTRAGRWPAGDGTARCGGLTAALSRHPVPDWDCKCGFYVHHNPIASCACEDPTGEMHGAVGVVRCWGQFVEHDLGSRWQHVRPVALVDFTGRLHDDYWSAGVQRYRDLNSMYAEWAPDRERWADERPDWCQAMNWSDLGYDGSAFHSLTGGFRLSGGANNFTFNLPAPVSLTATVQQMRTLNTSMTVTGEQMRQFAQALGFGVNKALQELSEKLPKKPSSGDTPV